MKIAAIISEYNPFHNGHEYQIYQAKKKGFTHIVAVMSGNFVQRGDFAIFDKYKRAKSAISGGVDLVIEIPLQFSLSPAERFAFGAISQIEKLGCVDSLIFGAETNDINLLKNMVFLLNHELLDIKKYLDKGESFPKSQMLAVKDLNEKIKIIDEINIDSLFSPNNILAFEYINTLDKLKSKIDIVAFKRYKTHHDSENIKENFASASKIRELIFEEENFENLVPKNIEKKYNKYLQENEYIDKKKADIAIMSYLKRLEKNDFADIFDVGEGIENRIIDKLKNAKSLNELYNSVKTKRYTNARVRRIIMNTFLNINKENLFKDINHIKVLAFNEKGAEVLKRSKKTSESRIITTQKELEKVDITQAILEKRAANLYGFLIGKSYNSNWEYLHKMQVID